MFLRSERAAVGSARLAFTSAVAALALGGAAFAQENQTSPPSALQFPFQAQSNAQGEFSLGLMRGVIEDAVDLALCKTLMRRAGENVPEPFETQHCLPAYAQQVEANSGDVHWSSGARPRTCGQSCLGRPMMTAEDQRTRPNLRRAHLFGRILLTIEPGPGTREVSLGYDAFFTCRAENGARTGDLVMEVRFGPPAIGGAGTLESIISNVFTAGELSRYVESQIRRSLPNLGTQSNVIGSCRSVGALRETDPAFDAIKWDLPASGPRISPRVAAANVAAVRDQVRIEFLRIVRRPLPALVAQEHGSPGAPESGQFTVFLNGQTHFLPPQGLVLPVTGGSAPLNFCTTIDVTNWNGLQVLFTNDLGGAAWSQFASNANYGHGGVRTLTTSRTIVVPGSNPPDPITGRPRPGARPQTVVLNEFELTYRISFTGRPSMVSADAPATPSGGTVRPGLAGTVLQTRPTLATDGGAPVPPCREI